MEWNAIEGSWKQVVAGMKQKWGALTDVDLEFVDKTREALVAKVRQRTGLELNTVERQLDAVIASLVASPVVQKPEPPAQMLSSGARQPAPG